MKRLVYVIVGIVVSGVVALTAIVALTAEKFIEVHRHDFLGLSIDVDDIHINWATNNISLKDVNIYPAGKRGDKNLLVSAKELEFKVSPLSLLLKKINISKIKLDHPKVRYISYRKGSNWDALDLSSLEDEDKEKQKKRKDKKAKDWSTWHVSIDEVELSDGEVTWRDMASGGKFELVDVDAEIENLVTEPNPDKLPSKMSLKAKLAGSGAPLKVKGKLNIFTDSLNMKLKASLKGAPLTYFAPFYRRNVPFKITSGGLSIKSKAKVSKNYLTSTHYATVTNLKASGFKGKLATKLVEKTGGKVNVTATVNGDLSKGNLRVSSAISKNISSALLAKAKELSPTKGLGTKVKSAGSKLKDSAGKLFSRKK